MLVVKNLPAVQETACLVNFYAEYIMRNDKLETRLLGEILIISDMQMTPPLWQKVKRN